MPAHLHSKKEKIVLAGDGPLVPRLASLLIGQGRRVLVLAPRMDPSPGREICFQSWNARERGAWMRAIDGATTIVNLWGSPFGGEDASSAIAALPLLGEAVRDCAAPPSVWIQASSLAIYDGSGASPGCDESEPGGTTAVAEGWIALEEALGRAALPTMRWAALRMGSVLEPAPDAPNAWTRRSDGDPQDGHWVNWIAMDDVLRVVLRVVADSAAAGIYNVCSPHPAPAARFFRCLRKSGHLAVEGGGMPGVRKSGRLVRRRPAGLVEWRGRPCFPRHLLRDGFHFRFDRLRTGFSRSVELPVAPCPLRAR